MAITLLDRDNASGTDSATVTLTGGAPTDGDLLFAAIRSQTTLNSTHGAPAGWTKIDNAQNATTTSGSMWYKIASGETAEFIFTSTGGSVTEAVVRRYSGIDATPLDQRTGAASSVAVDTLSTGTTGTTVQDDELVIVVAGILNTHSAFTWTNSFTNDENGSNIYTADKIVTAAGTFESTGDWTTARRCVAMIATFKASGGASTVVKDILASGIIPFPR